jgi:hypothetical protein
LLKVLRGDFWYWIRLGGNAEILVSIVARVLVKVVTDFTSIVHFRHPFELGATFWMFGFLLTMGSLPVAIILAQKGDVSEEQLKIAWEVVGLCTPLSLVCFMAFFKYIEREYWGTFISFERGKDLTVRKFKEGSEVVKVDAALDTSEHHWKSIRAEIKDWVEANWERWEEEKPEWFDETMRARVPVEYIPTAAKKRNESVRRASADAGSEGSLAGTLRASIRRASVGGADYRNIIGVGDGYGKVSSVVPDEDGELLKGQQHL